MGGGMKDVTIPENAVPITTPIARSKTFPFEINSLNSFIILPPFYFTNYFYN